MAKRIDVGDFVRFKVAPHHEANANSAMQVTAIDKVTGMATCTRETKPAGIFPVADLVDIGTPDGPEMPDTAPTPHAMPTPQTVPTHQDDKHAKPKAKA